MTKTIVILAAGMSSRMKKSIDSDIDDSKADEANKKRIPSTKGKILKDGQR